jgi:ABC-2 type transport system permease protein
MTSTPHMPATPPAPYTPSARPAASGVIHDIGYKPYTGERLGRAYIARSLYWFSLRSAYGLGRTARAKIAPFILLGIMMLPAAIDIFKVAVSGGAPVINYDNYAGDTSLLAVVFTAFAAPELFSRDLRHHTLPLYFSRPLRRSDYPLAKATALATAVFLLEALPLLVMYLGTIASATSGSAVWDQTKQLMPGLAVAVAFGLVFASLGGLTASTSGRRAIVTGAIAVLYLMTAVVSTSLAALGTTTTVAESGGSPPGAPSAASGLSGPGGANQGNVGPGSGAVTVTHTGTLARAAGMLDPVGVVEGARIWALDASDNQQPDPKDLGPFYVVELLVLIGGGTGGLILRYRKVGVA